ncbi:MAG TPA: glycosyltransferase family 2 protein [Myxococcales bacterium]|nr:glycosyltransferase family 2 protein [Myxococcales bacterium]
MRVRRAIALQPGEVRDAVQDGAAGWRVTGPRPAVRLRAADSELPSGWVLVRVEQADGPAPMLVDSPEPTWRAELPAPRRGVVRGLVRLPEDLPELWLKPGGSPFRVGQVEVVPIGDTEVALRETVRVAAQLGRAPGRLALLLRKAGQTLRSGGLSALRQRLLERVAHASSRARYAEWRRRYDTLSAADRDAIADRIGQLHQKPLISVLMPVHDTPEEWLRAAIESVRGQLYPHWELCIADDASRAPHVRVVLDEAAAADARIRVRYRETNGHISAATNTALELARGEYVALLDHDDALPPHALYLIAEELEAHPATDLLYTDEDKLGAAGGYSDPYFKPEFDPDLLLGQNYFCHLGVYRTALVRKVGGLRPGFEGSQDYDLCLRCLRKTSPERVRHVPFVLYHWRVHPASTAAGTGAKGYAHGAGEAAIRSFLEDGAQVAEVGPGPFDTTYRVRHPLPQPPPPVTIVIPTRDGRLLRRCLSALRKHTDYAAYEVVVVDNGSRERRTLDELARLQAEGAIRVLRDERPFNYSALNNLAAREARGEVLLFFNDDVEATSPGWLSEMVSQAMRPGVGAVGARLLYPEGTVQHAGIVLGLYGVAGHLHRRLPAKARGYFSRPHLVHEVSAVTAACLAVRKAAFDEVGGFDERNLPVAFNDVDFCLRLREKGYRNVWTPYAELIHHEAATRGPDEAPANRARSASEGAYMTRRWGSALESDPFYSPNLSLTSEQADLAWPPRVVRPWRKQA